MWSWVYFWRPRCPSCGERGLRLVTGVKINPARNPDRSVVDGAVVMRSSYVCRICHARYERVRRKGRGERWEPGESAWSAVDEPHTF